MLSLNVKLNMVNKKEHLIISVPLIDNRLPRLLRYVINSNKLHRHISGGTNYSLTKSDKCFV